MTRASWKGYLRLGHLGIPVRLYTGTQSLRPSFVQLHETDGSPIERRNYCRAEKSRVAESEIIKAIEYEPGRYITLTDQELAATTEQSVKTIDILQFCEPVDIPSIHYGKPFYIVPSRGGERAYALLREVLIQTAKLAAAQYIAYNRQRIAVINNQGDLLILQQLRYAAEIVPRSQIKTPALPKPSPSEIEALSAVVTRFSGSFFIEDYHDEYTERILELIERKAKGLPPPRKQRIATHATPENEIEKTLHEILSSAKRHPSLT